MKYIIIIIIIMTNSTDSFLKNIFQKRIVYYHSSGNFHQTLKFLYSESDVYLEEWQPIHTQE